MGYDLKKNIFSRIRTDCTIKSFEGKKKKKEKKLRKKIKTRKYIHLVPYGKCNQ